MPPASGRQTDARGQTTTYTYDVGNRRTQASYADGTSAVFEWDTAENGIGRLAKITEASGTTAWAYNRHGDIVERRQTADEVTLTTRHEYDAVGRKTATIYPSGMRVTYAYNADRVTRSPQTAPPCSKARSTYRSARWPAGPGATATSIREATTAMADLLATPCRKTSAN